VEPIDQVKSDLSKIFPKPSCLRQPNHPKLAQTRVDKNRDFS